MKNKKSKEVNVEVGEPPQKTALESTEATVDPETKYLTGTSLYLLGFALMAAIFMVAIDLSIICMLHDLALSFTAPPNLPLRIELINFLKPPLFPKSPPASTA